MLKANGLYGFVQNNNIKCGLLFVGFLLVMQVISFAICLCFSIAFVVGTPEFRLASAFELALRYSFITFAVSVFWAALAYWFFEAKMRQATGAAPAQRNLEPRIYNIVENLAIATGLPVPKIEIIESPAMNAYATGLSPERATIGVTRGLLSALDDNELETVIAHEITHIRTYDVRLMAYATILSGIVMVLTDFVLTPLYKRGVRMLALILALPFYPFQLGIIMLISAITAVLTGVALRFAISRSREMIADAGACDLTKNPGALVSALSKISGRDFVPGIDLAARAMMISGPAMRFFNTHPSLSERIDAINFYAHGFDQPKFTQQMSVGIGRFGLTQPIRTAPSKLSLKDIQLPEWVGHAKIFFPVMIFGLGLHFLVMGTNTEIPRQDSFQSPEAAAIMKSTPGNQLPKVFQHVSPELGPKNAKTDNARSETRSNEEILNGIFNSTPTFFFIGHAIQLYLIWLFFRMIYRGIKRGAGAVARVGTAGVNAVSGNHEAVSSADRFQPQDEEYVMPIAANVVTEQRIQRPTVETPRQAARPGSRVFGQRV
jgi:heat shock protein HtpX